MPTKLNHFFPLTVMSTGTSNPCPSNHLLPPPSNGEVALVPRLKQERQNPKFSLVDLGQTTGTLLAHNAQAPVLPAVLGCVDKCVELLALFTMRFGAKSSTDLPLIPWYRGPIAQ